MKLKHTSFLLFFVITTSIYAQHKEITLEEIWNGTFRTERMDALHSMKNGQQYSVLNLDRKNRSATIDVYDYKTLSKVKSLLNSETNNKIPYFTNYTFSEDESKIILATDVESIFRRSTLGIFYMYNTKNDEVIQISEEKIQEPTLSHDASKVAYGYKNNLYVKDLVTGNVEQITFDGEKNKIINGITDWVYEEEFGFVRAFQWNTNGNKIAYLRFDETEVPEFSMDIYGEALYQTQHVFKYPKAGEKNAIVSLYIFDLETNKSSEVELNKSYNDYYIPRIKWTNNPNMLSAQYMNRHQNELDLWMINATDMSSDLVLTEKDIAYIDVTSNLTFLKGNSFIWTSEKDGFNHIYHYSKGEKLINQITKGNWEITKYYGFDEKNNRIYYQSVENGSTNRDVYAIDLNGKNKKRLTKTNGTNNASFSADFSYFINSFSSATTPPEYTLNSSETGNIIKSIIDNDKLAIKLLDYKTSTKEFSTIHINGNDLNMWMIKPADFNPNKKYPLFMCQYSGPGSQQVANRWNGSNDYWYQMLAQQGYIIACVDGRYRA